MAKGDQRLKRLAISESSGGIQIDVASGKNWFSVLLLAAWIYALISMLYAVDNLFVNINQGVNPIVALEAFGFLVILIYTSYYWMVCVQGKEVITINSTGISVKHGMLGRGENFFYDGSRVKKLKVDPVSNQVFSAEYGKLFWEPSDYNLTFEYDDKLGRFALGLKETEANEVLGHILKLFPHLGNK